MKCLTSAGLTPAIAPVELLSPENWRGLEKTARLPSRSLFFLEQGPENKIEAMAKAEAIRRLMRNILFFAEDAELVDNVLQSACEFVERVPVQRLTFAPDSRVWGMIG